MKIHKEKHHCTKNMEELLWEGYDITLEGDSHLSEENWYCILYKGDSNSPWKKGTISGSGHGKTIEEALEAARDDLEIVTGFTNDKQLPVRSKFSVFLADFNARFNK